MKKHHICKHNARWLYISQLKASAVCYYFCKHVMQTKHISLNPGKVSECWSLIRNGQTLVNRAEPEPSFQL
jgi:hypothetical protein